MKYKKICYIVVFITLLGYYFYQYLSIPLDGDMAGGILHLAGVEKILKDPFGWNVIIHGTNYPNPNKFFSHWLFSTYYRNVPFLFQSIGVHPIESIYLSTALLKTSVQLFIVIILTSYINSTNTSYKKSFFIWAIFFIPFFQTNGFQLTMGIIDQSVTYVFFYAIPLGFLLLFYLPIYQLIVYNKLITFSLSRILFFTILIIILPFSGPLVPGLVLIISWVLIFWYLFGKLSYKKEHLRKIVLQLLWILIPISILSLYSLYLGGFNSLNLGHKLPYLLLYEKLMSGIIEIFTLNYGLLILLLLILLNVYLMSKNKAINSNLTIKILLFLCLVSFFYLLLLPLGGYRPYRPNIIRYDTFIPVTLLMLVSLGITTKKLIDSLEKKSKRIYSFILFFVLFFYISKNETFPNRNQCEKKALYTLSNSIKDTVQLNCDCQIVSWELITDYRKSEINAQLFHFWNITKTKKYYFQIIHPPKTQPIE